MLPILFHIGPLDVPSYGVSLAIGVFLAWMYYLKNYPDETKKDQVANLLLYSVLAGLVGARINYILEHVHEIDSSSNFFHMLFSRSGLTVYGGLILGTLTAIYFAKRWRFPVWQILDTGAPAICIGYFFGRLGCQLAGDGDYGTASSLPWAMAYPHGSVPTTIRVHPTPLYEMLLYAIIFVILVQFRKSNPPSGKVFALFLILAGLERFAIEFIRLNPVLAFGLTEAQIVSLLVAVAGIFVFLLRRSIQSQPGTSAVKASR